MKANAENTPVIVIEHLFKKFGDHAVLDDFNLVVNREEIVVVLGKSGAGKSVLIKCIIGLLKPDFGTISVLGQDVSALDHHELDMMRTKVGFLFQSNALYDSMTVRENLEFPLRRHWIAMGQPEIDALVKESLENVNLGYTIDMLPSELSGGMAKRIALARTMILKPEIILYDEPTSGLDPVTAREIDNLILKLQRKYQTAAITSDKVVLLLDGKCYAVGGFEDFERSADEKIKQFFE
jgi:phospholipid/cholesterol/gamma-HCH transport system ATP-binding protein